MFLAPHASKAHGSCALAAIPEPPQPPDAHKYALKKRCTQYTGLHRHTHTHTHRLLILARVRVCGIRDLAGEALCSAEDAEEDAERHERIHGLGGG